MAATLITTVEEGVVTLRINRPDHENRLNLDVLERMEAALREADENETVHAVVIRGTGNTFCCGGDVAEFAQGDKESYRKFAARFGRVHLAISSLSKPVLAAVNGEVRAGGMSLLSICDLAVARTSVRFAMPEIHDGLWPVMAMVALNRVLPRKRAFELYYFGEPFGVEEACELHLVNWVVPDEEFDGAVRNRARQLAALPPTSVRVGRETFAGIAERSLEDGYAFSGDLLVDLLTHPEAVAALATRKDDA